MNSTTNTKRNTMKYLGHALKLTLGAGAALGGSYLVSRATIQLGNKDRLGYSPGDIDAKMKPWMHRFMTISMPSKDLLTTG